MQFDQLGPYRLVRRIGRGGMGTVYEGINDQDGQPAAVKVLNPHLAAEEGFRERFEIEIETLKKLKHPNIVRLYGFGQQDSFLYYSMELVHGTNLEDELQAGRRFDWRETIHLGIKLARALKLAHDHGVVHRDLKPANLLLTPEGDLKLADFGIARLFGNTRITAAGGLIGTAEYMAPEQADGRGASPASDLYSFGGVMFAMLAGRPPFTGGALAEVLQLHRFAEPPRVSQYARDVPRELEEMITRLLAKEPADRGSNASIVGRQLASMEHALAGPPRPETRVPNAPRVVDLSATLPGNVDSPSGIGIAPPPQPAPQPATLDDPRLQALGATGQAQAASPAPAAPASPAAASPTASVAPPSNAPRARTEAAATPTIGVAPSCAAASDDAATIRGSVSRSILDADAGAILAPVAAGPVANRFVTVEEDERRRAAEGDDSQQQGLIPAWLQIAGLSAALAGLIVTGIILTRPPSADKLYQRIEATAPGGASDQIMDAEDDIQSFLARFPEDPRSATLRKYQEEIDLQRLERQLGREERQSALGDSMSPIHRDYIEAMRFAASEPHVAAAKLRAILNVYGSLPDPSDHTTQYLKLTRRHLEKLDQQIALQSAERLSQIDASLRQADEMAATDPAKARSIWSGIIELYADKPWAAARVARAKTALRKADQGR